MRVCECICVHVRVCECVCLTTCVYVCTHLFVSVHMCVLCIAGALTVNILTDHIVLISGTARHRISSTRQWLFTVDISLNKSLEIISSKL